MMEVEAVLYLHRDKGTKYCCEVLTFANRTAHLVNVLGFVSFVLLFFCVCVSFFSLWFLYDLSLLLPWEEGRNPL